MIRTYAVLAPMLVAFPAVVWGWGVPGCANLPAYNRALGALQGMTSACDMSVAEARRIVASHDGVPAAPPQAAPPPAGHRRHRGTRPRRR
ncbi:hypothetical protein Q8W71_00055 [Methylobacterium sp. NEAU 140]|uniref:hypothetical protein n=1 Tax=Methylobacterium sp. NEAU 140 TaxID=3064945 RepID=UPI002737364E|nr:hypothetical protein [Methylobacterium sp. NEAU 140]MDP4021003.1 hypothetical protein [Methylobacterium sp. NEAU 140]